jgi:two-component system, cell cycle response regulator
MSVVETLWERRPALLASLRDVTDKVRMRNQLKTMAFDDELTGLRNRRGFSTLGNKQLQIAQRRGDSIVLFFMDLDGLKWINDNLGHQEGDLAITDMADILMATFRQSDIIGRLGGDEFAVITLDTPGGLMDMLTERLQRMIDAHNSTAGRKFTLACSVGSVIWDPVLDKTLDDLLTRGDEVMYEVKRQRKSRRGEAPV